ncbi:MAG TPA: PKD domain-containing protein, partial [Thermoanaerobaculia bacterium]|nr:PKD domain-containing protein [Thermoanaerobaculia bacterium]
NTPPSVSIGSPVTRSITVPRGTKVSFTGSVADAENDATNATWTFSDTWETLPAANNVAVTHTFVRPGRYAVGLAATDSRGGIGAATVEVSVSDPSDTCGTALDISPRSDFPYSVAIDTDVSTKDITDPHTLPSCYPLGVVSSSWLTFTAPETGQYNFSLFGSEVSAILVGYTGECAALTLNGVCLTRPNSEADAGSSFTSATLNAGDTIRLLVSNYYSNDYGSVVLTVSRPSLPGLPLVTRIAPAIGSAGTPIVINGAGFQSGATVIVGAAPATNVSFVSARLLTATLGPRGDGDATVVVKNPDGTTATLNAGFTYASGATGPKRRAVKP